METFRRRLSKLVRQGGEHGFEHRDSELTGIGVKPGAVIAVGQQRTVGQPMQDTMCEWETPVTHEFGVNSIPQVDVYNRGGSLVGTVLGPDFDRIKAYVDQAKTGR